jgi:hypothetical protein
MNATLASNRGIENILVFPLKRSYARTILRSITTARITISDQALVQLEAITGGHVRAIELTAKFITGHSEASKRLTTWKNERDIYFAIADALESANSMFYASIPDPDVFDFFLSNPPVKLSATAIKLGAEKIVSLDNLIYTGQVIVLSDLTVTVAPWAFLYMLKLPTNFRQTELLQRSCELSHDPYNVSSWFEGFCLFFAAEALRRGGETLMNVVPHLYPDSRFNVSPCSISIEGMAEGSNYMRPLGNPQDIVSYEELQVRLVMERVNELKYLCLTAGNKFVILVTPKGFTALDAILVTHDKVIGIKIESQIDDEKLLSKVSNLRVWLEKWKGAGCDLLGSDGLLMFIVGIDKAPSGLQLTNNEKLVTAHQIRPHFHDVFFRFGLMGEESD